MSRPPQTKKSRQRLRYPARRSRLMWLPKTQHTVRTTQNSDALTLRTLRAAAAQFWGNATYFMATATDMDAATRDNRLIHGSGANDDGANFSLSGDHTDLTCCVFCVLRGSCVFLFFFCAFCMFCVVFVTRLFRTSHGPRAKRDLRTRHRRNRFFAPLPFPSFS